MKGRYQFFLLLTAILWMAGFPAQAVSQVLLNHDPEIETSSDRGLLFPNEEVSVWVNTRQFESADWRIRLPEGAALFMNEELWQVVEKDTVLFISNRDLESRLKESGKLKITAFKKGIAPEDLSVKKGFFGPEAERPAVLSEVSDNRRSKDRFKDFFFTVVLVILFFLALFRILFPSIFGLFWNPLAIFSFEDLWESVSFSKVYSAELLFYLILINMGMALMGILGMYIFDVDFFGFSLESDFDVMIFAWLAFTLTLTLVTFLKFIWLGINTYIFELQKIALPHFFYLLKVSGFGLLVLIGTTVIFYTNDLLYGGISVWWLYKAFLVLYTLGIIGLSIWLYKKNGFNNYHLFSYLCSSELIPFLVICKFLLG
ncbi:protein of unknown function [Cyclobacterium lianum]|uniref:DUF4271 domain-containing protein n=1 Tax=Cyclobacterium lianum TaxID=388280 RepID=A0A1M7K9Y7_9BACT|nr:DUF4271 domain-containing protein [Cyclobacterium lianum]SHM62025.1 protein of unknown function [Cyclobacterium lianum]